MDKEYIAHEREFQRVCEEKINDAIVAFQQGVADYFLGEYSEERCTDDEHYEGGVNFGDFLYCTQSDMIIDGKHKSLHGG